MKGDTAPNRSLPLPAAGGWPRIFYGWWVVLGAGLSSVLDGAFFYYGYGTFSALLAAEFGWSKTALGGAISLARSWQSLANIGGGYLADRFGPRLPMAAGSAVTALGFFWFSRTNSLLMLYVVLVGVIATGLSIGHTVTPFTAVGNWFVRRRGLATGIAMSGVGLSGLVVPLLGWLMDVHGWRAGALAGAVAFLAVGLPASALMRHRPERYGALPDGAPQPPPQSPAQPVAEATASAGQALHTPTFWLMALAFAFRNIVSTGITVHLVLMATDLKIALVAAAGFQAFMGMVSVPGRLAFGWLADHFDKRLVTAACMLQMATGVLLLALAHQPWHIALALVVYAPAYGGGATVLYAIRGEYFGRKAFGTIAGAMGAIISLGAATGPVLGGFLRDATGSYQATLLLFAGFCLASMALVLPLHRAPRSP
ncbi:MAG: MFS transporter [Chloroflexi bacterium]|nr:MFS transporter [Chloroflexota bacterium]